MSALRTVSIRKPVICLLPLLLACLACGPAESPDEGAAGIAVSHEMKRFERMDGECKLEKRSPCATFLAEYPEFSTSPDAEMAQALNDAIRAMLLAPELGAEEPRGLEAMAAEFLGQWRKTRAEFPEAASTLTWYIEHRIRVIHQDDQLLSVESAEQAYTGGAHPNASTRYASFAVADGRRLAISDLCVPGSGDRLGEIAERVFRERREIPADTTLTDAGFWFEDDRFTLNDNFAVVDGGLLFYFNAYEVGPYAAGPTEIVIPLEDLEELILPGGPLDRSR
jgi:hypothetical protein